ncbi:Protein CBG23764 [Caenorhabditis briggsae]|uniref:Protein CBG23764 n=1 Tax=Caenorhabditis briggsae TaxID=6238 RepID=A8WJ88_CAEBR|nr:Protein CBG23764 [Caenorhabditis briggsae]CAP20530.1 Protein CBG23764 [Caenorhabditis briggsae]
MSSDFTDYSIKNYYSIRKNNPLLPSSIRACIIGKSGCDSLDDIPDPSSIDPNKKTLIIFDDLMLEKQNKIEQYYTRGRHNNIDCFYISQNYIKLPKNTIRENANLFIVFPQDKLNLDYIYRDHCSELDKERFLEMTAAVWKDKYSFLTIDKTSEVDSEKPIIDNLYKDKVIIDAVWLKVEGTSRLDKIIKYSEKFMDLDDEDTETKKVFVLKNDNFIIKKYKVPEDRIVSLKVKNKPLPKRMEQSKFETLKKPHTNGNNIKKGVSELTIEEKTTQNNDETKLDDTWNPITQEQFLSINTVLREAINRVGGEDSIISFLNMISCFTKEDLKIFGEDSQEVIILIRQKMQQILKAVGVDRSTILLDIIGLSHQFLIFEHSVLKDKYDIVTNENEELKKIVVSYEQKEDREEDMRILEAKTEEAKKQVLALKRGNITYADLFKKKI